MPQSLLTQRSMEGVIRNVDVDDRAGDLRTEAGKHNSSNEADSQSGHIDGQATLQQRKMIKSDVEAAALKLRLRLRTKDSGILLEQVRVVDCSRADRLSPSTVHCRATRWMEMK